MNNRFSMSRVMMVARYFGPRISWQIKFYPLVSLGIFALAALMRSAGAPLLSSGLTGMLQYLVLFGPIVLATRNDYEMVTTLPARASEKGLFAILYSLVLLPLLAYGPIYLASLLCYGTIDPDSAASDELSFMTGHMGLFLLFSFVSAAAGILTSLWAVAGSGRRRILKGIIWPIVLNFVVGMFVGAYTAVAAISTVSTSPRIHRRGVVNYEAIGDAVAQILPALIIILSVYSLFAMWRIIRAYSRRQA